jgi:23S rRNA (uracil1939-C5)-methyltransferase
VIELTPTDMAHGGAAIGRVDGKAHFVDGALPGETIRGEVVQDRGSWARVELTEIVTASADRVEPVCPHFAECGGCQWQYADHAAQLDWKRSIVTGQLEHLGGVEHAVVAGTVSPGPPFGYRNRMDFAVVGGALALSRRRSRELVPIAECHLLMPSLLTAFERIGGLERARGLTLRGSATEGEVIAVVRGRVPDDALGWDCKVSRRDRTGVHAVIGDGEIHEVVDGVRLRITGDAFFQNNTAGATTLVRLVQAALEPGDDDVLLDGYAGGGLFAATIGRRAGSVIAVESNGLAVFDLRHNLAAADVEHTIVREPFESFAIDGAWDLAVVDPPRQGLGEDGVDSVARGEPRTIAYVSCDPASLARDTRHLGARGYSLDSATPVDLFPQTFHVETVARFTRT